MRGEKETETGAQEKVFSDRGCQAALLDGHLPFVIICYFFIDFFKRKKSQGNHNFLKEKLHKNNEFGEREETKYVKKMVAFRPFFSNFS